MNEKLVKAMNEQINKEIYSAFLYLAMSEWAMQKGLKGAAHWLYVQYLEEMAHGQNIYRYLQVRGDPVELYPVAKPESGWNSLLEVYRDVLAHEKTVTASIANLANISQDVRDHATSIFLEWYVTEQVEEEGNATDIIQRLQLAGDNLSGLLMIDTELSARTFAPPVVPGLPPAP
ncbi:MAG: ferritin [Clostridiaceae bacterium]|nr:ferritin [Clostridiaceae bacterium]